MAYTLLIGNKNYSSWSLRPWLMLHAAGIPFREEQHWFDTPEFAAEISSRKRSPNGRVPVLVDGDVKVWDSLAIAEYLAERHPGLWPVDAVARAHARSACAEMHSSFGALRNWMPMNVRRSYPIAAPREDVRKDIERIQALWTEARAKFGASSSSGPYLYGTFSIADAYFAPVVFRFSTYGVKCSPVVAAYVQTMLAHPSMQQWIAASKAESAVVQHEEPEFLYENKTA
ncbi:MAG: glutathione S-transferase family protein [Burkholderiales bacterium]|nr:glutathione S-transferase family protein [Burkholderiales bacterium]